MAIGRAQRTSSDAFAPRPGIRFVGQLSRDRLSERGAALVEAMLVLPILILVCFGLIEFGLIYKDTLKIASAARAGARTGAAAIKTDGSDGETQDADYQILQAVQAALGTLAGANHLDTQIVVYKSTTSDGTPVSSGCDVVTGTAGICNAYTGVDFASNSASFAPNGAFSCSTTTYPTTCARSQNWPAGARKILFTDPSGPEWLGVWVKTRHDYTTAVFGQNRTLSDQTVLRLEPPGVNPNLYSTSPSSFATTTNPALTGVQGTVWNDANKDGVYQAGVEPGLSNVAWKLTDTTTGTFKTGTTSGSGTYSATTTPGDLYQIVFTAPSGDTFTTYGAGATNSNVNQATGASLSWTSVAGVNVTVNAGIVVPGTGCTGCGGTGSISGIVWSDANHDGIRQTPNFGGAEVFLQNVSISLYITGGTTAILTTTTNVNGNFSFGSLGAGTYYIKVTNPNSGTDVFSTMDVAGSTAANDSDVSAGSGSPAQSGTITVTAGANTADNDAGIYVPGCLQTCSAPPVGSTTTSTTSLTSISGNVWNDINYDGIRQGTETLVSGETVQLINPVNSQVITSTTTNASGHYVFSGLVGGFGYQIRVVLATGQSGFAPLHAQGGDTTTDSDMSSSGYTGTITAVAGSDTGNNDAGIIFPTISGVVWNDANSDGIRQTTESKHSGVTVKLLNSTTGAQVGSSVTTDSNGYYQFSSVAAGGYQVQFVLPATYTFSPASQGTNPTIDSNADPTTGKTIAMTTTLGSSFANVDAGLIAPIAQTTTTIPPS
jgi:Flp pilus assembly protein TadG